MSTSPNEPKTGLLYGIDALINAAVNAPAGPTGYRSVTTARHLNEKKPDDLNLSRLVNDLWSQMVVNWLEGGCQSRGKSNWRWELRPEGGESEGQPEVALQRRIARFIDKEGQAKDWSNETPTGSGLTKHDSGNPGGLDLARKHGDGCVDLIELKFKSKERLTDDSNTPVAAAFQVVIYGLLLILARSVDKHMSDGSRPLSLLALARLADKEISTITNEVWRNAEHAHLRVLAPATFYSRFLGLRWLEEQLGEAVGNFGTAHGLPMSFRFREFDKLEPKNVSELIDRLGDKGKIPWK